MAYLQFDRVKFLNALVGVKPGLAKKDIVEQASKFVFKDKCVYTFNEEIAVVHPIEHDIVGAVPATELYDLISNMTDDTIEMEIDGTNMHIKGSKNLLASLKIETDIKLLIDTVDLSSKWLPLSDKFIEALKFALLSVGTDLSKPILTCVHWTPNYIESCDNFRLTRYNLDTPDLSENILLSNKIADSLKNYEVTDFSIEPGWAKFKTKDECIFSCRIYSGSYVDLNAIISIPRKQDLMFTEAMLSLLNRVAILAEKDIHGNSKAVMRIVNGLATVTASSDVGEITESTRIKCASDITFEFKIEALIHILQHFKKALIDDDKKTLCFNDSAWAHVIPLC